MHPRSPFNAPTVFAELAKKYPDLAKHIAYPSSLNFRDPEAVRSLSKCLLHHCFSLEVELPDDRLCPMIPNRLDYILWLQDLVDQTGNPPPARYEEHRKVVGLDIGTGASAIYPLLGCALRQNWTMIGTDIDPESLESARKNAMKNAHAVGSRIKIHTSTSSGLLIPISDLGFETIDFVMCNPPFYGSEEEISRLAQAKELPPLTACTGSYKEMVYEPDGEIGFARRILKESLQLRSRVQWYTTLFGKLSSVQLLVKEVIEALGDSGNWAVTQFVQGTTRRWAVGWSFDDRRPKMTTCMVASPSLTSSCPFSPEFVIRGVKNNPKETLNVLKTLSTLHKDFTEPAGIYCEFTGNAWSRAWRRASLRGASKMGERVRLGALVTHGTEAKDTVTIRWVRGDDKILFESFCEMVRRKITE